MSRFYSFQCPLLDKIMNPVMIQNIQGTRIVFSTRSYSYSYFHVFIVNLKLFYIFYRVICRIPSNVIWKPENLRYTGTIFLIILPVSRLHMCNIALTQINLFISRNRTSQKSLYFIRYNSHNIRYTNHLLEFIITSNALLIKSFILFYFAFIS